MLHNVNSATHTAFLLASQVLIWYLIGRAAYVQDHERAVAVRGFDKHRSSRDPPCAASLE